MTPAEIFKKMAIAWHLDITPRTQVDYCEAVIACSKPTKLKVQRIFKYFKLDISKLTLENCIKDLDNWYGNAAGTTARVQTPQISPK